MSVDNLWNVVHGTVNRTQTFIYVSPIISVLAGSNLALRKRKQILYIKRMTAHTCLALLEIWVSVVCPQLSAPCQSRL